MNRKLRDVDHFTAEVHWTDQEDAWQQRVDQDGEPEFDNGWPVGEAAVEREIIVLDSPAVINRIDVWNGLFGGVPSRDQTDGVHKSYNADSLADAVAHGQIQEITTTVYAREPKNNGGYKKRVRLFERDIHQLTPSASFPGTEGREFVDPIELPEGTLLYFVTRTSQRDRGAHTRVSLEVTWI